MKYSVFDPAQNFIYEHLTKAEAVIMLGDICESRGYVRSAWREPEVYSAQMPYLLTKDEASTGAML